MRCVCVISIVLLAAAPAEARAQAAHPGKPPATRTPPPSAKTQATASRLGDAIRPAIRRALDQAQADGDFGAAEQSLADLFDQVIAYADADDKALFADADFALRMIHLLAKTEPSSQRDRLRFLLANPDLARALVFLIKPEREKPAEVFAMLDRLREKHGGGAEGGSLNTYANLAAAICVVHDRPLARQINENRATAPDPVLLYEYFVANEKKMLLGIRNMPAELLVYVVDSTASLEEMQWALKRYAGDQNVGARFFDIKYDTAYLRSGDNKKVDQAGWNLPNILKYGGICADQAYFAVSVGKAIGVPTAYTVGASAEAGHAWVGFVQSDRDGARWNFNAGRYREFQGVRGSVIDPQTGRAIPDSYIALLADFVDAKALDRQAAAALTDAAKRLIGDKSKDKDEGHSIFMSDPQQPLEARKPPEGFESATPRGATTGEALTLLEAGLKGCPGYADGWFFVRQLAEDKRLTLDDKKKWEGVLHKLCGERYPDFYLAIVKPMIATIEDANEQNALWNGAFRVFQNRLDLAASVRMEQADMWQAAGETEKAGQCYEDVINRYANAGPFVIDALRKAETMLRKTSDERRTLALYQRAWSLTEKPRDMAGVFMMQSNWFRVGKMYADRLNAAGLHEDAMKVSAALGMSR